MHLRPLPPPSPMILSCIFFAIEGLPKINETSENVMSIVVNAWNFIKEFNHTVHGQGKKIIHKNKAILWRSDKNIFIKNIYILHIVLNDKEWNMEIMELGHPPLPSTSCLDSGRKILQVDIALWQGWGEL